MKNSLLKKIIVGTAQLGCNYGIANKNINIDFNNRIEFLNFIYKNNLQYFDTAFAYSNSHKIIIEWIKQFSTKPKITSKIPNLKNNPKFNIKLNIENFLSQIDNQKIENLLLHNPIDWENSNVKKFIYKILQSNTISKFGFSIYSEKEIPKDSTVSIIQVPGNIFNQSIILSDELNNFIESGGDIQIRSIFIQGLLLMEPNMIPAKLNDLKEALMSYNNIAKELNVKKSNLAIQCIHQLIPNAKIVIGFDNIRQVKEILEIDKNIISKSDITEVLKLGKNNFNELWDPRNWN